MTPHTPPPLSRRTVIAAALAAASTTAAGAAAGSASAAPATAGAPAASPPGDVVGKITVGYQGWFACSGDGAPINGWWHWAQNWGQSPSPSNTAIVSWPDVRDYSHTYRTAYPALGGGQPASLFSSYDQQTVDTHFAWMREYGIDTAALQRFNPNGGEGATRDAMAGKVRSAAETYGRKFYVMYDATGWTNMQPEMKADWLAKMKAHTASPAYARQNGKPVVGIWGFGFNEANKAWSADVCLDVVNWFKDQGCYVMGGVPTHWRRGVEDSRPGYSEVYHALDMLSPWMVGRIGDIAGADNFYANVNTPDQADCDAHGVDYQPCVLPGDLQSGHRAHGDFMWRQFYNMKRVGVQGIYISMFDEYNEGNQIAKTAENASQVPAGSGIKALDEDGTACSSDYYLRLTGDGGRMLKGELALTPVRPTRPLLVDGPQPTGDLALRRPVTASGQTQNYGASNAVDGDSRSYWESPNNAWPQWIQVDLGAVSAVRRVVLSLPPDPAWDTRTQTLSVLGGAGESGGNESSFTTLATSAAVSFDPAKGNTATVNLPATARARYVRVRITGNSGWPAGQLSGLSVYASAD
ncbi:galactose-binding domain-containing protein [Streptomyces tsukubensis]|uniref:Xylosidase n=1 Tax=Streptomyces tsukubensis TaxID=83656 RepID=A0A1V4A5X0_9ACTN|nr:discoidin domain-containing protein [Streptomyces tsukubensis]OON76956.1 xylosidase [Streptomyces tsukubensis]QFR93816.1 xylosidase [Streptomyces tsukubensis]